MSKLFFVTSLLKFKKKKYSLEKEREWATDRGTEGEGETVPGRLPLECKAQHRA